MQTKPIAVILSLLLATCVKAQNFDWVHYENYSSYINHGSVIASDDNGNAVIGGYYYDSNNQGSFISKYDCEGHHLWSRKFTPGLSSVLSLCLDENSDTYAVVGFAATMWIGNTQYNSINGSRVLVKLDRNGNILWKQQLKVNALLNDRTINGNVIISGSFNDTVMLGGTTMIAQLPEEAYIAMIDPLGNFIWAIQDDGGDLDICSNTQGEVFIAGTMWNDTITLGKGGREVTLHSNNDPLSTYVAKYDAQGNLMWAAPTYAGNYTSCDEKGNAYVCGTWMDAISHCYIEKYTSDGSQQWKRTFTGSIAASVSSVSASDSGIYLTGRFDYDLVFDDTTLYTNGNSRVFTASYDEHGERNWINTTTGTGAAQASAMAAGKNNTFYIMGQGGGGDINFGSATVSKSSFVFISRVAGNSMPPAAAGTPTDKSFTVYPNPSYFTFKVDYTGESDELQLNIRNSVGQTILSDSYTGISGRLTKTFDASVLDEGIYMIELVDNGERTVRKLVISK